MTARLLRFVRPTASVIAVLLVAGALQAAPAAAAPSEEWDAAISITAKVVYPPDDETPGPPGTSVDAPADAGPAPGTLRVSITIANVGTEPLDHLNVLTPDVTNGQRDSFGCTPITDFPEPPLGDPELTLYQGQSLTCTETISGIVEGTTHENTTTVVALGTFTGTRLEKTAHVWAEAGPPASPSPTPSPPPPASVGHRVWLDTNRNRTWEEGEPGIPGAHLEIELSCCQPMPDGPFFADTTTDEHGIYHFRNLEPGPVYTLTLYLYQTPVFADLAPWSLPPDTSGLGNGSLVLTRSFSADTDDTINFGFVPKDRMSISIDAPTTAVAGTTIEVKGHASLPDRPDMPGYWGSVLEFRAGGTTTWTKVAGTVHDASGDVHTQVRATRSGWFRYQNEGDGLYIAAGVSREDHVLVRTAPVALTAKAPASVRPGASLEVTGTITRAGTPFKTGRITLQHATDASTWTTVADVRSTDGTLTATVKPARTGSYRFRYAGDSRTASGSSPAQQVVVSPAVRKPTAPPRAR